MFVSKISSAMPVLFTAKSGRSDAPQYKITADSLDLSPRAKAYSTLYHYYAELFNDADPDYKGIDELSKKYPKEDKKAYEAAQKSVYPEGGNLHYDDDNW